MACKSPPFPLCAVAILAYWIVAVPAGYLLAFPGGYGPVGVWIGLAIGLGVAALFLTWRFHHVSRAEPAPAFSAVNPLAYGE